MDEDLRVAIPEDVALLLCTAVRQENRGKWYTLGGLQCWGCTLFSRGKPDKMCLNNKDGYHGCNLVNKRYDRLSVTGELKKARRKRRQATNQEN